MTTEAGPARAEVSNRETVDHWFDIGAERVGIPDDALEAMRSSYREVAVQVPLCQAKKVAIKVKLTPQGKSFLRKAKRLKVTTRSGYLPQGGDRLLAATKAVQLGKKRR